MDYIQSSVLPLIWTIGSILLCLHFHGIVADNRGAHRWLENSNNWHLVFLLKTLSLAFAFGMIAAGITGGGGWAFYWVFIITAVARIALLGPVERDEHGSARFLSETEIKSWADEATQPGLLLGRTLDKTPRDLKYTGDAHLISIAPSRSGKGVSAIIPNLLTYPGSILVVDPKGENARVAARKRAEIGKTYVLDPFDTTGLSTASYNPLSRITADNPDANDDAAALADALVTRGPDGDNHWDDEAAALLEGIILFVALHEAPERRHLGTVRELITEGPEKFEKILEVMQDCGGLVERTANRYLSKSDREASSVLSTAQRHTKFLDSARMTKVLGSASGLSFRELKQNPGTTVFLCIPPDRLDTYDRWLRLMVNEALLDMVVEPAKPDLSVLFLLDEFAALGQLQTIKRAMGLMAGYGMRLWPFLQDLSQLKATYGDAAQTFFANAGAIQWFGINDIETAKQVSETIGQTTIVMPERDGETNSHGRSLVTPDELMTMDSRTQIIMLQGKRPAIARKISYYDDPAFSGAWDSDPKR
ncbi:MAG: type IV secretory system conjugative DNA transfer family protein [Pseudomonadota bacterium]